MKKADLYKDKGSVSVLRLGGGLNKKTPKYMMGGFMNFAKNNGEAIGQAGNAFGQLGGENSENDPNYEAMRDQIGNSNPFFSMFHGIAKMGEGIGQSIGGNYGGNIVKGFTDPLGAQLKVLKKGSGYSTGQKILSALIPFASGFLKKKGKSDAEKAQEEEDKKNETLNNTVLASQMLASYLTDGVKNSQYFARKGTNLTAKLGLGLNKKVDGGTLKKVNNNAVEALGDTHEQDTNQDGKTGITIKNKIGQDIAEVEHKEVIAKLPDGEKVVFSNYLKTEDGTSFADTYKKLSAIKEREDKSVNKNENKIQEINEQILNLYQLQQQQAQQIEQQQDNQIVDNDVLTDNDNDMKRLGGGLKIPKYRFGSNSTVDEGLTPELIKQLNDKIAAANAQLEDSRKQRELSANNDITIQNYLTDITGKTNPSPITKLPSSYNLQANATPIPSGLIPNQGQELQLPNNTIGYNRRDYPLADNTKLGATNNQGSQLVASKGFNMGNISKGITAGIQYLPNVVNAFLTKKTPQIPKPTLINAARLKTDFNINPALYNANKQLQSTFRNFDNTIANSQDSRAAKIAAMASSVDSANELYGQKENVETQLTNNLKLNNQAVFGKNAGLIDDYNYKKMLRIDDIHRRISENVADAVRNYNANEQYNRAEDRDLLKLDQTLRPYQGNDAALYKDFDVLDSVFGQTSEGKKMFKETIKRSKSKDVISKWNEKYPDDKINL